jgi:parallel beta-helix repeat protein
MKKRIFVAFICMLLISIVFTASGTLTDEKTYREISIGSILYVGGGGPGNYTTIQDAIDDSTNGDTVFVYDDSSPYFENIVIDKSIELIGENKETTIIDGYNTGPVIWVLNNNVSISRFIIQNCMYDGILISQDDHHPWDDEIYNVNIHNNNIKNVSRGIFGITLLDSEIFNNIVKDSSGTGICLCQSSNNNISDNYISNCEYRGIEIYAFRSGNYFLDKILNRLSPPAEDNILYRNTVEHNRWGIEIGSGCSKIKVVENNIINNFEVGIQVQTSSNVEIKRNNILKTENYLEYSPAKFSAVNRYKQFFTNTWDENYWNEPKDKPVAINGVFHLYISIPIGFNNGVDFEIYHHNLVAYDKNPAQEPYEF